jgi:hypothetical protein
MVCSLLLRGDNKGKWGWFLSAGVLSAQTPIVYKLATPACAGCDISVMQPN